MYQNCHLNPLLLDHCKYGLMKSGLFRMPILIVHMWECHFRNWTKICAIHSGQFMCKFILLVLKGFINVMCPFVWKGRNSGVSSFFFFFFVKYFFFLFSIIRWAGHYNSLNIVCNPLLNEHSFFFVFCVNFLRDILQYTSTLLMVCR